MNKIKTEITTVQQRPIQGEAEALIAQAINKNVPVETMERLLAMRRELRAEHAKEEYDHAMAGFQSDCPTIAKTKEVKTNTGAIAYKYAPIESIVDQVKDSLSKHGFSYSTNMELLENGVRVSVKITHSAGHSEVTDMTVPFGTKTNIMSQTQVVAAATTFAKRYAFCNAFGILTGDEDTDAAPAVDSDKVVAKDPPNQKPIMLATDKQIKYIHTLLTQKGFTADQLKKKYSIAHMHDLAATQASEAIEKLMKLPNKIVEPKTEEIDVDEVDAGIKKSKKEDPGMSLSPRMAN